MVKRCVVAVAVVAIVGLTCGMLFAMCGTCEMDSAKHEEASSSAVAAVNVNNTICPVSGEPTNSMNPVTVEYKGKAYNLCCPACTATFKADPEKYSKIAGDQAKAAGK